MTCYNLDKVLEARDSLQTYLQFHDGKHTATNSLITELLSLDFTFQNLKDAKIFIAEVIEIERRYHAAIMSELKKMGKTDWPGMYIMHDLICAAAHLNFCIRYAIKDERKTSNG